VNFPLLFFLRRTPIELVKCKMQVQMLAAPSTFCLPHTRRTVSGHHPHTPQVAKLPGPIEVLKTVIRTTGFRGLWLGQTGTLIRETGAQPRGSVRKSSQPAFSFPTVQKSIPNSSVTGERLTKKDLLLWESGLVRSERGGLVQPSCCSRRILSRVRFRPRGNFVLGPRESPPPTFFGTLEPGVR
jgi:ornithine carrier protein